MSQIVKNLLAAGVVALILLALWAGQTLYDSRPALFLRLCLAAVAVGLIALVLALTLHFAHGRDLDGRYAQSPLKPWFDSLKSKNGPCCSDADGSAVADVDWRVRDGHYQVRLDGEWIDVSDDAVITEPNRAGRTMVWPFYLEGRPQIRCFMPGSMT